MAADDLATYLKTLVSVTSEPQRFVAHSHGCNVVEHARICPKLDHRVYNKQPVYLACPRVTSAHSGEPLYPLGPGKFGVIHNFYSEKDPVVRKVARGSRNRRRLDIRNARLMVCRSRS